MFRKQLIYFFVETANLTRFAVSATRYLFKRPFEFKEFLKQSYVAGNKSFALVSITALIMGLVLTIQTRPVLAKLGAESWLPGMVFLSVVMEIGPVITSLIFAGKVGSRIGAELGSMKVTEQIDAMEVSGTYPMKYLVVTRVLATTIMLPLLVIYADFIALLGSYLGVSLQSSVSFSLYISDAFKDLHFYELFPSIIKTFVFGYSIGILSCYQGYYTNKGAEGVGMATTSAVIYSSLSIFIIDLIAVQITEIVL